MKYNTSIFWFRRDLRLHDNHGFFNALTESKSVVPIFIFDISILNELDEEDRRVSLLFDKLNELNKELSEHGKKIHVMHGKPSDVIDSIYAIKPFEACYTNTDYEPYARQRDDEIKQSLQAKGVEFHSFKDQVIFEKDDILTDQGNPYGVFTPYMKKWKSKFKISMIQPYASQDLLDRCEAVDNLKCVESIEELGFIYSSYILHKPNLDYRSLIDYDINRDIPDLDGTSNTSVHLRFGFVSVREIASIAFQYSEPLLNEIIWRSFFSQVLWHNPHVVTSCYREKYNNLKWNDTTLFRKWKYGLTGFPIVDAGMRQLFDTGYMHNRVRMIAASFLVKNLGIDWRLGEAYFASKLMDFDLASNNGNWQWVAGTGCDASPYFRVFNPDTQLKKFDPKLKYCKKWIIEIHDNGYYPVERIADVKASRLESIARYKACQ